MLRFLSAQAHVWLGTQVRQWLDVLLHVPLAVGRVRVRVGWLGQQGVLWQTSLVYGQAWPTVKPGPRSSLVHGAGRAEPWEGSGRGMQQGCFWLLAVA